MYGHILCAADDPLCVMSLFSLNKFLPMLVAMGFVYKQHNLFHFINLFLPQLACQPVISYSYITSMSRISLLLHEIEGEARSQVLTTMISYEYL